jgi:hypothetical protein
LKGDDARLALGEDHHREDLEWGTGRVSALVGE